jgi:hypothetical protein
LARIGKFVKKKKTGYSVFWGLYSQKISRKNLSICSTGFFFLSFLFLLGCFDARILQKKRKKKTSYRAFSLFNDRFWFLQNSSNWWYPKQFFLTSREKAPFTHGVNC